MGLTTTSYELTVDTLRLFVPVGSGAIEFYIPKSDVTPSAWLGAVCVEMLLGLEVSLVEKEEGLFKISWSTVLAKLGDSK